MGILDAPGLNKADIANAWGDSIAPPGPSFWESIDRIGTPVYGFLQEQTFSQGSGYGNVQVLAPAATRRIYIRRIVVSADAKCSGQLLLASDSGNVRGSDAGRFGYWRRAIPLAPVSGDNQYMPQNTYWPLYLEKFQPIEFKFDGEFWMDPGIALLFGAKGVIPSTSGNILGVLVTNGGSGYSSAPAVSFTGGGGSGAAATATITGGVVTGITITNPGSGYLQAPTVGFSGGGGASAAGTAYVSPVEALSVPRINLYAEGREVDFDAY